MESITALLRQLEETREQLRAYERLAQRYVIAPPEQLFQEFKAQIEDFEKRLKEKCVPVPLKKPRRATWEQLAYWLIDGKGLVLDADTNRVDTGVYFDMKNMHEEVGERYYVMARGESRWYEPTVDYMGLEEA